MATGTVKWFNDAKGYGFIKDKSSGEEGGSDIWCHGKNGKERELSRAPFV